MNVGSLVHEAKFAWATARNWRSRSALLAATARFHLNNRVGHHDRSLPPVDVDITIGKMPLSVSLRQHTGDLFVFYEVLAFDAYAMPAGFLAEDAVHTIVDCGANVGMTSLYYSQRYPRAQIFAIEPEPGNFACLTRNTSAIDRIVPIHGAIVGTPSRSVRFGTAKPAWGNSIVADAQTDDTVEVPAMTMDQLIERHGIGRIDLLKVDIEGGEVDLFRHPSFLDRVGTIAIELHGDYDLAAFQAAIAPAGFVASAGGTHPGVDIVTARRPEP